MFRILQVILGLFFCFICSGEVIRDIRLVSPDTLPADVTFANYGDKSARTLALKDATLGGETVYPWIIINPKERSWGFLVCDVPIAQIPDGARLRLTVWVSTNTPGFCRVVLSKNATWGGYCPDIAAATASRQFERHPVSVECVRQRDDKSVSLAVGLDYYSTNSWVVVDRMLLEQLDTEETSIAGQDQKSFDCLPLPVELIEQAASEAQKHLFSSAQSYAARLRDHGVGDAAGKIEALLSTRNEIYAGTRSLAELAPTEEALFNSMIAVRMLPGMAPFQQQEVLAPDAPAVWKAGAAKNALDYAVLLVANNFAMPLSCTIKAQGEGADAISFHRLHFVSGFPDCPIEQYGDFITEIGTDALAGFQVTFSGKNLPPGTYRGEIVITPLNNQFPVKSVPYEFTVANWQMPEAMPIPTFAFDYGIVCDPAQLEFLTGQRINTFHVPMQTPEQLDVLEKILDNVEKARLKERSHFFVEVWFVRAAGGWQAEFAPWLERLAETFRKHGISCENWVLHIYDESLVEEFFQAAQAIHALNPAIRIYSDAMPSSAEDVQKFASAVNVWCPHMTHWLGQRKGSPVVDAMRQSGLPIHLYNCDSSPTYPLNIYRVMPWVAWLDGCTGISFWTANPSQFRQTPGKQNFGMSYTVNGKPVPSRRWMAWSAGFEDYLMLQEAAKRDATEVRRIAEKVVECFETPEFPEILRESRRKLLEIIAGR